MCKVSWAISYSLSPCPLAEMEPQKTGLTDSPAQIYPSLSKVL